MREAASGLVVVASVSGLRLALPAEAVVELVAEPALVRAPEMPPVLAGLMLLRGRVVPVVQPDRLLGLPSPGDGLFRVLAVFAGEAGPWALLVERADEVRPAARLPPPPDIAFNDCVVGVADLGGEAVPLLSPERMMRRKEAEVLAAFVRQAAERWKDFARGNP